MAEGSFSQYVKEHLESPFASRMYAYVSRFPGVLGLKEADGADLGINRVTVESVWPLETPGSMVIFYVSLSVSAYVHEASKYRYFTKEVYAKCQGDMAKGLSDWEILDVGAAMPAASSLSLLDDGLMPEWTYEELEDRAVDFLCRYMPQVLEGGPYEMTVEPEALARRLGLSVLAHGISSDGSVFGQMYFQEGEVSLYDSAVGQRVSRKIAAGTIVYDPAVLRERNQGALNNTIVHECVHWVYHAKPFWLEKWCAKGDVSQEVSLDSRLDSSEGIEKQASQLTPRIQMPRPLVEERLRREKERYEEQFHRSNIRLMMPWVVDKLAHQFQVSQQAMRIRLLQLGHMEADGAAVYLDGSYVLPYGFREGSLGLHQTFSISLADAMAVHKRNKNFRELLSTGYFVYVDHHFVFYDEKYVVRNEDNCLMMTSYALDHMDECCLIFDVWYETQYGLADRSCHGFNHQSLGVSTKAKQEGPNEENPNDVAAMEKIKRGKAIRDEIQQYMVQMTGDPKQCLRLLMDWKESEYVLLPDEIKDFQKKRDAMNRYIANQDMNQVAQIQDAIFSKQINCLAREAELAPKTIQRMVTREVDSKLETVAAICLALHLYPTVSEKLIHVLGCYYVPDVIEEHWYIQFGLQTLFAKDIAIGLAYLNKISGKTEKKDK